MKFYHDILEKTETSSYTFNQCLVSQCGHVVSLLVFSCLFIVVVCLFVVILSLLWVGTCLFEGHFAVKHFRSLGLCLLARSVISSWIYMNITGAYKSSDSQEVLYASVATDSNSSPLDNIYKRAICPYGCHNDIKFTYFSAKYCYISFLLQIIETF